MTKYVYMGNYEFDTYDDAWAACMEDVTPEEAIEALENFEAYEILEAIRKGDIELYLQLFESATEGKAIWDIEAVTIEEEEKDGLSS